MIRCARLEDVADVVRLINSHPAQLLPRRPDEVEALLDTTWVAEEDGNIVGCCVLEVYSPKIAEIRSVVVRPEYRGRGLGQGLIRAAVAEGRRRRIGEIMVITSTPEYFERLNFGPCLNERFALFWGGAARPEAGPP
jgi:amino-acid N-acetyltransferase